MPELTPEWITALLLIVGAIVAAARFVYGKMKYRLKVEVMSCNHKVRFAGREGIRVVSGTELVAEFRVTNAGDNTSIYAVELKCKPGRMAYSTTENVRTQSAVEVARGATETYTHDFFIPKREISENNLKCTFKLHHAYGKKKVRARSSLRP